MTQRRVWTVQPNAYYGVDPRVTVAVLGSFATTRLGMAGVGAITQNNPVSPGARGRAIVFDRATPNPINTGYVPGTIVQHSAIMLLKHRDLSNVNTECYITNRISSNTGFLLYEGAASGIAPNRTASLQYVLSGVADYTLGTITGGDDKYIVIGFSARPGSTARGFVNGAFVGSASIGSMNQNTQGLYIGRDVNFSSNNAHYDMPLMIYMGSTFLSDAEHAAYARNPWQLFRPAPRRIFAPGAAAAPGGFIPAWAYGATSVLGVGVN